MTVLHHRWHKGVDRQDRRMARYTGDVKEHVETKGRDLHLHGEASKNFALNVGRETWTNVESKCAGAVRMWINLHRLGRIDLSLAGRNRAKKHEMTLKRHQQFHAVMTTYCVQGCAVIQWWYSDTYKSCTHNDPIILYKHLLHSIQVIHSVLAMPTIFPCLELNMSDTLCYQHYLVEWWM